LFSRYRSLIKLISRIRFEEARERLLPILSKAYIAGAANEGETFEEFVDRSMIPEPEPDGTLAAKPGRPKSKSGRPGSKVGGADDTATLARMGIKVEKR